MSSRKKATERRKLKNQKIRTKINKAKRENNTIIPLTKFNYDLLEKKYGLSISTHRLIFNNLEITSKLDHWRVEAHDNYYALYHKDHSMSIRGNGEHLQDVFYDLDFLLASIVSHDENKLGLRNSKLKDIHSILAEKSLNTTQGKKIATSIIKVS